MLPIVVIVMVDAGDISECCRSGGPGIDHAAQPGGRTKRNSPGRGSCRGLSITGSM